MNPNRKRNYLAHYLNLAEAETHEQLGHICDLSDGGLMFITELSIPIDEIKEVYIENKIAMPDIPEFSIKATIKILWEKPNFDSKLLCIGCSILEIADEDRQRLNELVSLLSFGNDLIIHRTA